MENSPVELPELPSGFRWRDMMTIEDSEGFAVARFNNSCSAHIFPIYTVNSKGVWVNSIKSERLIDTMEVLFKHIEVKWNWRK